MPTGVTSSQTQTPAFRQHVLATTGGLRARLCVSKVVELSVCARHLRL